MTLKVNALFTLPSKLYICAVMDRQIDPTSFFFLKRIIAQRLYTVCKGKVIPLQARCGPKGG